MNLSLNSSEALFQKKCTSTEPPQTRSSLAVRERIESIETIKRNVQSKRLTLNKSMA